MPYEVLPREIRYGGRNYYRGDPIEPANPLDAHRLKLVGKIKEVPAETKPARTRNMPKAPRRAVVAEASEASPPAAEPPAPAPPESRAETPPAAPGRYLNRRLQSED